MASMSDVAINPSINVNTNLDKIVEYVDKVVQRLDKMYSSTRKVEEASKKHLHANAGLARGLQSTNTAMQTFNKSSQDLTKSVQVALGPLSGVAARITALTALFNRNTFAAAAMIGSFTGFIVATKKMVRLGIETELQMLRMEAVITSLGDSAAFTANELEGMAQRLAQATLASVTEAREAVTTLATFSNIAPEAFEKATRAAYAFSDVMGGQLAASVRQIGVLLEDPVRNMEMLRRRGIQFTKAERDKIDVLMRSGRILEANNAVLEKFEILTAQSEAKSKLLGGTLDRTSQLLQNFFESVNKAGGVTGSVNRNIGMLNEALERLLTNETFIYNLGRAFELAGSVVSATLKKVTENIEFLSAAIIGLVTLLTGRVLIAIGAFTVKIIAASTAIQGLRNSILGLYLVFAAGGAKGVFGAVLAGGAALVGAKFVALAGAFAVATYAYKKFTQEVTQDTRDLNARVKEFEASIASLPKDVQMEFKHNIDETIRKIKELRQEQAQLELQLLKSQRRQDSFAVRRGTESPRMVEETKRLEKAIEETTAEINRLNISLEKTEQQARDTFSELRRYGGLDLSNVIRQFEDLEGKFFPEIADAKKKAQDLSVLKNMLEDIANVSDLGIALIDAGIDETRINALVKAIETGKVSAEKASDSWKGLANTFADVQFNIEQLVREFDGLDNSMQIPPSLMRQWEALTSGERSKLTGMGVTPETLTAEQNIQKELNDLLRYRDNILASQLTEYEKIAQEAERMLGILEQTDRLTENVKNQVRDQIDSYIELKAIEPFKDLEKQVNEQQQLNAALRQGETEYNRVRREIEVLNKVEAERLRLTQLDAKNIEERVAAFEEQLRVMALLRAEYDELNANLQKYKAFAQDLGSVISNSFEEAIVSGNRLRDVLQGLLDDILRIATRVMITKPLENALVGALTGMSFSSSPGAGGLTQDMTSFRSGYNFYQAAKGGIMTSGGPVPLKSYARGGIATSPQLAMFGEGSQAEAYVPLPDGKRIPVAMQGASNVNISIINNVGAEITTTRTSTPQGESIEVMIDRAVASKLAERGSDSNRSLRSAFNMRPTLAGR